MEDSVVVTEQMEEMGVLIKHPIVEFYKQEVAREIKACPCDDCDPCDYEAR